MKALKKMVAVAALALPLATFAQDAAKPAEPPKITVTPYGIIYLGATLNDGVFTGASAPNQEYPAFVLSEDEGAMVLSARQSRFGFNVNVPTENIVGAAVTGKVEFDFMGGGSSGYTNANMRLRHAFLTASMAAGPGKLVITAGQTDGLLNALHPESTSYLALPLFQQAGNLHRRTGQIRLGYDFAADAFALKLEAALLNPTYGKSDIGTAAVNDDVTNNAGNRSGMGDLEARLGVTMKPISDIGGTVGVSYHAGKRTYGATVGGTTTDVTTSAIGVDLAADVTQYLSLRGEYFHGEGIDDAYAGIATSSVNGDKGVKSDGYWAQAIIKPIPALYVLAGLGNETIDDGSLPAAAAGSTQRLQNDMFHGGLLVNMNKSWRVGLEYVQTKTKSRAGTVADPNATAELTASQISLSTQLRF